MKFKLKVIQTFEIEVDSADHTVEKLRSRRAVKEFFKENEDILLDYLQDAPLATPEILSVEKV